LLVNGVWVTMLFGILATRFRDIAPLLESMVQLLFYMTPIVWTTQTLYEQGGEIAERARIAEINPLYHYLEIVRAPMIGQPVDAYHWWIVLACTAGGILLAFLVLRRFRARVPYWVGGNPMSPASPTPGGVSVDCVDACVDFPIFD